MTQIQEVRVARRENLHDPKGSGVQGEINRLGLAGITSVRVVKVFRFEGIDEASANALAEKLVDIDQAFSLNAPLRTGAGRVVEVGYKPGVMNPEVGSVLKMGHDLGYAALVAADTSTEYHFDGSFNEADIGVVLERLLVNKTVERVIVERPTTLTLTGEPGRIVTIPLARFNDDALMNLSKTHKLALDLGEMHAMRDESVRMGRPFTDGEVQTTGQTWSEHCKHKTFIRKIRLADGTIKSSLMSRLKRASHQYADGTISMFVDNSGVVVFYDGWAICIKIETHNSPSAIEPYGGAATGVGGVLRDIMGTGQGAKVILALDMFCFARPTLPMSMLPQGCLHPEYLLRRVVAGVRDYGNRMGVPTVNGSIHFDDAFCAKPTVIVGAVGLIPADRAKKGAPQPGDLIVSLGGRTGRDGINGATFSSEQMTDTTISVNAGAVQIGHAIEEKRMGDAILALRDRGFIKAITDCGAGGFSSAVGEMGEKTGAHVRLERAPLKYPGLAPWEVWISESQERMVLAIDPTNEEEVIRVCGALNVEATVIGTFTDNGRLLVTYNEAVLCDLTMAFLHDGLPERILDADWQQPVFSEPHEVPDDGPSLFGMYEQVLGDLDVCSKEQVVRLYDHGVQGGSALPPFSGVYHDGPNDAAIIRPLLDKPYGVIVGHGMNPGLNRIDPYWGAISSAVEGIANVVATGADPSDLSLVDNFIWPVPDKESLGALDLAIDACVKIVETFKAPFISGKDSLSGTYRSGNTVIKIPPVLCVTALGKIPDVAKTASADFKSAGSRVFLVGVPDLAAMGGSVLYRILGHVGNTIPKPDLAQLPQNFAIVHSWIMAGKAKAVHDVSEGGIVQALAEMCFGGNVGAELYLDRIGGGSNANRLFNQTPGCLLVEVDEGNLALTEDLPAGTISVIGRTIDERRIRVYAGADAESEALFSADLADSKRIWQAPMKEVFP